MKLKTKIFTTVVGCCFVLCGTVFAYQNQAEESLSRGKRLYADGRYEEAMDNFIDVFVSGNTDQIAEANEYVNLIHFDRGGVVAPKQVPYDAEIEKKQNRGVQGRNLFDKTPQKEAAPKDNKDMDSLTEVFVKEKRDDIPEPDGSVPEADPFNPNAKNAAGQAKQQYAKNTAPVAVEAAPGTEGEVIVDEEISFPKGSKAKVRALQKEKENKQRAELVEKLISKLNANEDIQVYMRGGRTDAIDITANSLFRGREINKKAYSVLDDIYALMILEDSPSYVILPEGSYTDDITLQSVRQAVALNTYLINRGISPAKMNLNMGLTTQEPPEKFSNLAGISIVFDYEGKSRLKSKLSEENLPPVLSLAVYPFKEITPAYDETFVVDFSVIEGSSPVKKWSLQIVNHAADDHYYVVKQLSGTGTTTHQFFWNGRKRYFGHFLPVGKYTVVIRATDGAGRERVLKRQLILKEAVKKEKPVVKTEAEVLKAEKVKKAEEEKAAKEAAKKAKISKQEGSLDYSQNRLWNKPGKKKMAGIFVEEQEAAPLIPEGANENEALAPDYDNVAGMPEEDAAPYNTDDSYGASTNPYNSGTAEEESTNPYKLD